MKFQIGIERWREVNTRGDLVFDDYGMFRPGFHVNADPSYLQSMNIIEIEVISPASPELFQEYLEMLGIKFIIKKF